jgi:hypothetical protein
MSSTPHDALFKDAFGNSQHARGKDAIMTAGHRLIGQGIEHGTRGVLLRQLRKRFGREVNTAIEQRSVAASVEQLDVWVERVLTAATLRDALAE